MLRKRAITTFAMVCLAATAYGGQRLSGTYVEARTCQVYTGPCFANGEVGSVGKNAVMTWQINHGEFQGADLAGQSVAVVVKASHTLGFNGFDDATEKRAFIVIDSQADEKSAAALKQFALARTGLSEENIAGIDRADIDLKFNYAKLTASVEVGDLVKLQARKARKGDCICSNESAYYPPLTELNGFVPGVTIEGEVSARPLGTRWSIPDTRTAYLGTFDFDVSELKLASN